MILENKQKEFLLNSVGNKIEIDSLKDKINELEQKNRLKNLLILSLLVQTDEKDFFFKELEDKKTNIEIMKKCLNDIVKVKDNMDLILYNLSFTVIYFDLVIEHLFDDKDLILKLYENLFSYYKENEFKEIDLKNLSEDNILKENKKQIDKILLLYSPF